MSRKTNPPIRGHELIAEGHARRAYNAAEDYDLTRWVGGCRCGAQPEGFGEISVNAVKRWHRQHKAELRADS